MIAAPAEDLFRAQFGEDRVLWEVFQHGTSGYFIEVGAYDGVTFSNTYFLEQMGWCGLLIEPDPEMAARAAAARPRSRVIQAACGRADERGTARFTVARGAQVLSYLRTDAAHTERCRREGAELVEIDVPVRPLDEIILAERDAPHLGHGPWNAQRGWCIDLISIDVEGTELDVLHGLNLGRFKPSVLVMENDRPSGAAIEPYLARHGYAKFHRQAINDFYVRQERVVPG